MAPPNSTARLLSLAPSLLVPMPPSPPTLRSGVMLVSEEMPISTATWGSGRRGRVLALSPRVLKLRVLAQLQGLGLIALPAVWARFTQVQAEPLLLTIEVHLRGLDLNLVIPLLEWLLIPRATSASGRRGRRLP